MKGKENRRDIFLSHNFKVALFTVMSALSAFIILWGMLPFLWLTEGNILLQEIETRRTFIFLAGVLLYSLCMFWISYRWSGEKQRRILNRMDRLCQSLAKGEPGKLVFREGDNFAPLADSFNGYVSTQRERKEAALTKLKTLKARLEQAGGKVDAQTLAEWEQILNEGKQSSN